MDIMQDYFNFMKTATTAVQTIDTVEQRLIKNDFEEINLEDLWMLEPGGKYYVSPYPSMMIAFTMGKSRFITKGFNIIVAHTDNPALRIKPVPEIVEEGMLTLNVEKYGGPILNTWFDRPLSIAGRIAVKSDQILKPNILHVDLQRPILTLPNIAIHMNKGVNQGQEIKVQKEMKPLIANLIEDQVGKDYLLNLVADELDINPSNILDMDLYVYCAEEGLLVGANEEYISCPRIDDLAMVYAAMESLLESDHNEGINMAVFFDNEEIGSMTKQGADSILLATVLDRIRMGMNRTQEQFSRQTMESFIISADGAHGLHPNYKEKNDLTSKPVINEGIAIKISGNKSYASEVESIGAFQQLCEHAGIKYQKFINHSDEAGGKTLGPILTQYMPVHVVDVGVPMLAMHSTRELMGKQDFLDTLEIFKNFYRIHE
jgi:aspartyl aminopeptidase